MKKSILILLSIFIFFSCSKNKIIEKTVQIQDKTDTIISVDSNTGSIEKFIEDINSQNSVFPEEFQRDIEEMNRLLDNN